MGYYTTFTLTTEQNSLPDGFPEIFESVTGYKAYYRGNPGNHGSDCEIVLINAKWYNWSSDIITLSQMYPDYLFILKGEGEENGDKWVNYAKNGKSQFCKAIITFEPFDENKMK